MDSSMFGALVHVESAPVSALPAAPKPAVSRTYPAAPQQDDDIELSTLRPGSHRHYSSGPLSSPVVSRDGKAPRAPLQNVDMTAAGGVPGSSSSPTSPTSISSGSNGTMGGADAVEAMQSFSDPPMNRYRMISICSMQLLGGLNDAAPGALIPYMET